MNVTYLSNLMHLIAKASGLRRYHFGYPNTFGHSIGGDLPGIDIQAEGQQYPALIFEPPRLVTPTGQQEKPNATLECTLWFGAQLDLNYSPDTHLEQQDALIKIARQFIVNLKHWGLQRRTGLPSITLTSGLTMDCDFGIYLDRLLVVRVDCQILVQLECLTPNFNPAALPDPSLYPPTSAWDYEDPNNQPAP